MALEVHSIRKGAKSHATLRARAAAAILIIGGITGLGVTTVFGPSADATVNSPSWTIQETPNPGTAVGSTLAIRWNGTSWTIQGTPSIVLNGVACTSATNCVAVGSGAEAWNGTAWTVQKTPMPTGASEYLFGGVSCTSPSACTAVGYYSNKAFYNFALAERWNGTKWSIEKIVTPAGDINLSLAAVSCTSINSCIAVGIYDNGHDNYYPLAEQWNGTKWTYQKTPHPSGAIGFDLSGVSCTSSEDCTAVGGYSFQGTSNGIILAERWNGTKWSIQKTPNPSDSILSDVSCTSSRSCTAVGSVLEGGTLAERWNGSSWTVQTTPSPVGSYGSGLAGVSCTSLSTCNAVGYLYPNSSVFTDTLAESES